MIVPGPKVEITLSELLEKVSDEELIFRYVANFERLGKPFKSEIRGDKHANSCFIFKDGTGKLKYKDFADPNIPTQISIVEYVAYKYNETLQEAINRIAYDFKIVSVKGVLYDNPSSNFYTENNRSEGEETSSDLIIKIKKRDWTKADIEYWNSYHIPIEMLERNNIKSISHLWMYKNGKLVYNSEFSKTHPIFSYEYYWHNGIFRRKIYRPLVKEYKWVTNTDRTVVQNYPNIPKNGDLLFAQSSYKDCMVMELLGYNSLAPNGESTWFPLDYWNKLQERWERIVIYGNNDWNKETNPGLKYAENHSKRYGIPYIVNPYGEPTDISDYVKKYDLSKGKELVERLISEL